MPGGGHRATAGIELSEEEAQRIRRPHADAADLSCGRTPPRRCIRRRPASQRECARMVSAAMHACLFAAARDLEGRLWQDLFARRAGSFQLLLVHWLQKASGGQQLLRRHYAQDRWMGLALPWTPLTSRHQMGSAGER